LKALIDGTILLDFNESVDATRRLSKTSFMHWALNKPAFAQGHAARQLHIFNRLKHLDVKPIKMVQEFFGGVGMGTGIVQKLFQPESHIVYEVAEECLAHLRKQSFSDALDVRHGEAEETMLRASHADLFIVDMPSFNPLKLSGWMPQLDHLFGLRPTAISLNDTSFWSWGLHKERFGKALNKPAFRTVEDYVMAYSEYMFERYGYIVLTCSIHVGASFLYIQSDKLCEPEIRSVKRDEAKAVMQIW
jgi:hypothetical protein